MWGGGANGKGALLYTCTDWERTEQCVLTETQEHWRQEEIQGKLQKLAENGRRVSDYPRLWNCGSIKV